MSGLFSSPKMPPAPPTLEKKEAADTQENADNLVKRRAKRRFGLSSTLLSQTPSPSSEASSSANRLTLG